LGVEVKSLEVRGPADFDKAFETVARERVQAVIVVSSRLMSLNRQRILDFAAKIGWFSFLVGERGLRRALCSATVPNSTSWFDGRVICG